MAETIKIGGELESVATGGIVAAASAIKDKSKNKTQEQINAETDATLAEHTSIINGLNSQNYVTVTATDQTTAVTDVLPATGSADTVYRVGNWDGSQFDASVYSEYAWDGSSYVHLNTKTQVGEVFDISAYHATGGELAKYADLTAALDSNNGGGVPQSLPEGGMSIKYVRTFDSKYVQYRLTKDEWSVFPSDWVEADSNKVDNKVFYVTDGYGNIIAKIDKDGVHSVDFNIGNENTSVKEVLNNIPTQISTAVNAEKLLREQAVAEEEQRARNEENKKLNFSISDDTFYLTDANGYIIAKIDANGVHSVNIDEEPNKIANDNIVVTDSNGYIIFKIDNEGVHAPNLSEGGEVNSDNITIQDKNGYIVARIDKDGIHSAKDKYAVACMVLSESYYPIAAPTRDSDGNVTYAEVMFETGVAGSISITYTNGNSSSVAVVYGNYNYTITINRDMDGNVETVNVQ